MSVRRGATRWRTPICVGLAVAALGLCLSACKEVEEASAGGSYEPAKVEARGNLGVNQVTFTQKGADRVDLETAVSRPAGRYTLVPYAALIYDGDGLAWVYTSPQNLTFLRTRVVVDRIEGNQVLLADGPPPGTRVVTVGAAEVYGAELGIAGGH
jgi:multidrug efflux pump subunit AcrA (membrane-fusion protein)